MRVLTSLAGQGYVDGCFSDRSDGTPCGGGEDYIQGHVQVHQELQEKLGNGPLIANRNGSDPKLRPGRLTVSLTQRSPCCLLPVCLQMDTTSAA